MARFPVELLQRAQSGDGLSRDELIRNYTPFALRVAAGVCRRYLHQGVDDEASIAMIAMNEAIDAYREGRGASFLTFAETLIKRRLVDYYRKESRTRLEIPISAIAQEETGDDSDWSRVEARQAQETYQQQDENENRREEILQYSQALQVYGIRMTELVRLTPRHQDARQRAVEVAVMVAENTRWRRHLELRGELPLKELSEHVNVSRKTLERQRKYIIALVLAVAGDYPHLREYITQGRRDRA